MTRIDLTPLYRNSVGFDRIASLLDNALRGDTSAGGGYPPYNIEATDENHYTITIAVAGFEESELELLTERGVLTVRGKKEAEETERKYLYQGIAARAFERKFNLAEHVEVTGAELRNGLLNIHLVKEVPEAMKPRSIAIKTSEPALENKAD
ncbi:heat-shock protein [Aliidiomarina taiwanensis]|uniref:Heat-shock protein n=1 Tax=Aliidiomarina taiwanensis TaxID=946228 RepID=A0A432WVQ5_9GAMM|nr:Hsp20 family protein [Aliidiomarina taiwanensis]RUO37827.1 heat-shock protein [Aliidiomarina taiwanensis]